MQVIICGAGQVGFNIARYLSGEDADITIIDQSPELISKISESLDVKGLVGFASHPDVLERAGAADADLVIAVTYADEVNMVACQICHSIFDVPTKIARVRHQSYLDPCGPICSAAITCPSTSSSRRRWKSRGRSSGGCKSPVLSTCIPWPTARSA